MALVRGKFGVEYNPRQTEPESSGFGWIVATVAIVAIVSFGWTVARRFRARASEEAEIAPMEEREVNADRPAPQATAPATAPTAPAISPATSQAFKALQPLNAGLLNRPPQLRNLLMRLDEAKKRCDVELAVNTIERIRALPGSPAADMDDSLARQLGSLNVRRLFDLHNGQWVKTVAVRRGDSASRIAAENGSTLASFARLNGGNIDRLTAGAKVLVMDHPRFILVLHRRTRIADLSLNGKFFRRYDLQGEVRAHAGSFEMPERRRLFWNGIGAAFRQSDRNELDQLLPSGAAILVSEM